VLAANILKEDGSECYRNDRSVLGVIGIYETEDANTVL